VLLPNKDVSNFVNTKYILIMRTLPWVSKKPIRAETCLGYTTYVHVIPSGTHPGAYKLC